MPKRAHLCYLSALFLITACSVVPAENPYDETAALDIQKKGRVIGRVNLEANTSYTHDFDARPLTLRIKDLSTGLYVLDEQGEAISYETRNSSAALPDDLLPVEGLDAAGTFEIELAAGEYSLFFDANEKLLSYSSVILEARLDSLFIYEFAQSSRYISERFLLDVFLNFIDCTTSIIFFSTSSFASIL